MTEPLIGILKAPEVKVPLATLTLLELTMFQVRPEAVQLVPAGPQLKMPATLYVLPSGQPRLNADCPQMICCGVGPELNNIFVNPHSQPGGHAMDKNLKVQEHMVWPQKPLIVTV